MTAVRGTPLHPDDTVVSAKPGHHRSRPGYAPEMQVVKYVAVVQGQLSRCRVFTTGSPRHYLFQPLDVMMDPFPVLKADLRDDVRRALANGCGNASE